MADTTILNGDVGVTWLDNNRCKYLEWIGGTNDNYTMNQLYSAMQTLQDESTTIDDGTCFSAETPTEYTIGIIDQGDNDPWYITYDLMEHITGGALKTASWTRVEGSNTGIIMVEVASASNSIVASDAGLDISHTDTDAGTLLEVLSDGGTSDYLIIRPDSSAAANSFDNTTGTLTCNAHTATSITAVGTTGEQVWANLYTIGTVEDSVHMYIYQGEALTTDARNRVFSWNSNTLDWYAGGHIDTTVALYDMTQTTWSVIDGGYLNVYARKGGDLYASFEVANSTTSGGRNPVPLQTAVDLDQGTGTKTISFTGAVTGTFTDGEIIRDTTTDGRGILDATNSDLTSDGYLSYFPIAEDDGTGTVVGGALTAMASGNTVQGASSSASVTTNGAPANAGPALGDAWFTGTTPTVSFTATTSDVDNDATDEYYGITINCNSSRLSEVYEWCKYVTQYGAGAGGVIVTAEPGVYGEEYNGATASLTYVGGTTPTNIAEGESVTQPATGATGVVISHDTTNKKVLLRSTRGTFNNTTVNADDDSSTLTTVTASNFAAKTASPLGTFAGGTFFGARGVLLSGVPAADENAYILTDIDGGTYTRPTSLTFAITNLVGTADESVITDDRVSMFRLTGSGGNVDKTEYTSHASNNAEGDATLEVTTAIADDVPAAGSLVVVQNPGTATATEFKIRYTSWTGSTFTLSNTAAFVTTATTNATQVTYATGGFDGTVFRGDLVHHLTKGTGYVKSVDSDTQLTLEGAGIATLTSGDTVEINCVPDALDASDNVYVPFIDKMATSSTESTSIIDPEVAIYYRVKVRNTRATSKIKPYSSDGNTTSSNVSVQITRTPDTIIT